MGKTSLNEIKILTTLLPTPLRIRALRLTNSSHNAAQQITWILNVQDFKCLGNMPAMKRESL